MAKKTATWTAQGATQSIELGYYKHFKGNYYQLISVATHSETLEPMVVYKALSGDKGLWVRPAGMWTEMINRPEYNGPRFVKVTEVEAKNGKNNGDQHTILVSHKRRKWSKAEERNLVAMFDANESYETIANKLKRTVSAVTSRLQLMGFLRYDKETQTMIRIK